MDDAFFVPNEVPETDNETLVRLDGELKGTTMLEKPRVSKKIMVAALRGQNKVLTSLLKEADDNRLKVKFLTDKTTFMRESIDALEDQNRVQASTIARQQDCINELQRTVDEFRSRVAVFDEMNKKMREMEAAFGGMSESIARQASFNSRMESLAEEDRQFKQGLVVRVDGLERDVKAMPSSIVITSDQVLLEKVTGALKPGVKATTLRDAVKEIKTSVDQFEGDMGIVRKDLQKHEEDIQQRASLDFERRMEQHVAVLEHMRERFEAQDAVDLLDVRRNLNMCLESIDEVRLDLMMKINAADVDEKIEERYEDIVDHLMKALKTVQDDEDDFRKATEDLHAALDNIKTDKADKGELEFVKERIQKMSEESAKPDAEILDSIQKRLTKEEVEEMIEDKVDKDELTRAIEDLTKTLNQYATRLRKMRPGADDQRLLGGLAKTLKICNMDPSQLGQAPLAGNALAVTEGLGSRNKPHPHLPFKICLSCHSQLPNAPKEKVYTGAAYGGGFQLFLPGTAKGPPLRTGTPASPEQVTFSEMPPGSSASPNKKDAARKQLRSSESSPAPKSNSPRISDVVSF